VILGELANFGAYSLVAAILVTPLGALSVVISAIFARIFLNERMAAEGIVGCMLALLGATVIVVNAPHTNDPKDVETYIIKAIQPGELEACVFFFCFFFVFFFLSLFFFYIASLPGCY
jgi:hypothetical protein